MAKVSAGSTHTLARPIPYEGEGGAGDHPDIPVGTKVTVRETVAAKEKGAHNTSEDSVVIEWEVVAPVADDEAEPVMVERPMLDNHGRPVLDEKGKQRIQKVPVFPTKPGTVTRAMSVPASLFNELFGGK